MENKLFRKSALDRVSSPEQLNEYMKVAGPGVWAILGGLVITFAAFIVWGLMGSIPETVHFNGTVLRSADGALTVHSYLPIDETRQLEVGMNVCVAQLCSRRPLWLHIRDNRLYQPHARFSGGTA